MNHLLAVLLAGSMLAGCTTNSGVATTPTFTAARYLPPSPDADQDHGPRTGAASSPSTTSQPVTATHAYRGARAVSAANVGATVEPDSRSMRGASWYIDDADQTRIYRIATAPGRVTTILLPPGERFNGAVGGDVEGFLINVTYAGPRPAVSILPRSGQGRGNLQLVTTGGFYSFELQVNRTTALNLVNIGDQPNGPGQRVRGRRSRKATSLGWHCCPWPTQTCRPGRPPRLGPTATRWWSGSMRPCRSCRPCSSGSAASS